jgi:hypothetical protein
MPECTKHDRAQDYFRVVYGDDSDTFQSYHAKHSGCLDAQVTPWVDGRRQVRFRMQLQVPAVLKKAIGAWELAPVAGACQLVLQRTRPTSVPDLIEIVSSLLRSGNGALPRSMPAGVDSIGVVESQSLEWRGSDEFIVQSDPALDVRARHCVGEHSNRSHR